MMAHDDQRRRPTYRERADHAAALAAGDEADQREATVYALLAIAAAIDEASRS